VVEEEEDDWEKNEANGGLFCFKGAWIVGFYQGDAKKSFQEFEFVQKNWTRVFQFQKILRIRTSDFTLPYLKSNKSLNLTWQILDHMIQTTSNVSNFAIYTSCSTWALSFVDCLLLTPHSLSQQASGIRF
jgi:hypothetical protein